MLKLHLFISSLFILCAFDIVLAESKTVVTNSIELESFIKSRGFVGTILVKKGDTYLLRKVYGYADAEHLVLNNIDTRYHIGSLTKSFTALAIVQLKNAGKITSYEDTIDKYIQDYPGGEKINIRHLLTHRSGIPNLQYFIGDFSRHYSPLELVKTFKDRSLEFEPGTQTRYSNSNYILLGYLIELLSGIDYESYLHKNIFSPLSLISTEYGSKNQTLFSYALGYEDDNQVSTIDLEHMSIPFSAGALTSTVGDLEIWAESFAKNKLTSDEDNKEIFPDYGFGFGWHGNIFSDKSACMHEGEIGGFSSLIAIYPESKGLVIALSNAAGESENLQKILRYVAENQF